MNGTNGDILLSENAKNERNIITLDSKYRKYVTDDDTVVINGAEYEIKNTFTPKITINITMDDLNDYSIGIIYNGIDTLCLYNPLNSTLLLIKLKELLFNRDIDLTLKYYKDMNIISYTIHFIDSYFFEADQSVLENIRDNLTIYKCPTFTITELKTQKVIIDKFTVTPHFMIQYKSEMSSCLSYNQNEIIIDTLKTMMNFTNQTSQYEYSYSYFRTGVDTYSINITIVFYNMSIKESEFNEDFSLLSCNEVVSYEYNYNKLVQIEVGVNSNKSLTIEYNSHEYVMEKVNVSSVYKIMSKLISNDDIFIEINKEEEEEEGGENNNNNNCILIITYGSNLPKSTDLEIESEFKFKQNDRYLEANSTEFSSLYYLDFIGIPTYLANATDHSPESPDIEVINEYLNINIILSTMNGKSIRYIYEPNNITHEIKSKYYIVNENSNIEVDNSFIYYNIDTLLLHINVNEEEESFSLIYNGYNTFCISKDSNINDIYINLFNLTFIKDLITYTTKVNEIQFIHNNIMNMIDFTLLSVDYCPILNNNTMTVNNNESLTILVYDGKYSKPINSEIDTKDFFKNTIQFDNITFIHNNYRNSYDSVTITTDVEKSFPNSLIIKELVPQTKRELNTINGYRNNINILELDNICPIGTKKIQATYNGVFKSFLISDLGSCITSNNNYYGASSVFTHIYNFEVHVDVRESENTVDIYYIDTKCYNSDNCNISGFIRFFDNGYCMGNYDVNSGNTIQLKPIETVEKNNLITAITCPLNIKDADIYRKTKLYTITDLNIASNSITIDAPYIGDKYQELKLYRETGKRYQIFYENIAEDILPFTSRITKDGEETLYPVITELNNGYLPLQYTLSNLEPTIYYIHIRTVTISPDGNIYFSDYCPYITSKPMTLPYPPTSLTVTRTPKISEIQSITLTANYRPEIQRLIVKAPIINEVYVIHAFTYPDRVISDINLTYTIDNIMDIQTEVSLYSHFYRIVLVGSNNELPNGKVYINETTNNVLFILDTNEAQEVMNDQCNEFREIYKNTTYIYTFVCSVESEYNFIFYNTSEMNNLNITESYITDYKPINKPYEMTSSQLQSVLENAPSIGEVNVIKSSNSTSSSVYYTITFSSEPTHIKCMVNDNDNTTSTHCNAFVQEKINNIEGTLRILFKNTYCDLLYPPTEEELEDCFKYKFDVHVNVNLTYNLNNTRMWDITFVENSYNYEEIKCNLTDLFGYKISYEIATLQDGNEIGGHFYLLYNQMISKSIPYNASADEMKEIIESFDGIDDVLVKNISIGSEGGTEWLITFISENQEPKDVPLLESLDNDLTGDNAHLHIREVRKGAVDSPRSLLVSFEPPAIYSGLPILGYTLKYDTTPLYTSKNNNSIDYNDVDFLYYDQTIEISAIDSIAYDDYDNSENEITLCLLKEQTYQLVYDEYISDPISLGSEIREMRSVIESIPVIKAVSITRTPYFINIAAVEFNKHDISSYSIDSNKKIFNILTPIDIYINGRKYCLNGQYYENITDCYSQGYPTEGEYNIQIIQSYTYNIHLENVIKYSTFEIRHNTEPKCTIHVTSEKCDGCIIISNVITGYDHYLSLSAYNDLGESEYISINEPIIPCEVSGSPNNVHFVIINSTSMELRWEEPIYTGGKPILYYIVEISALSDFSIIEKEEIVYPLQGYRYRFTNLVQDVSYYGRVLAVNEVEFDDNKHWGYTLDAFTTHDVVPDVVNGASITFLNPNTIRVLILEPNSDGGKPVTSYIIQYGISLDNLDNSYEYILTDDIERYPNVESPSVAEYLVDITYLEEGKTYYFRVAAKNVIGSGEFIYTSPSYLRLPKIIDYQYDITVKSKSSTNSEIESFITVWNTNKNSEIDHLKLIMYEKDKPSFTIDELYFENISRVELTDNYSLVYYLNEVYTFIFNYDSNPTEIRKTLLETMPELENIEVDKKYTLNSITLTITYRTHLCMRLLTVIPPVDDSYIINYRRIQNGIKSNGQNERQVLYINNKNENSKSFRPYLLRDNNVKLYSSYVHMKDNCKEMIKDIEWSYSLLPNIGKVEIVETKELKNNTMCKYLIDFISSFNDIEQVYVEYHIIDGGDDIDGLTCDGRLDNNEEYKPECIESLPGILPPGYREFEISSTNVNGFYEIPNILPSQDKYNIHLVEYYKEIYPPSKLSSPPGIGYYSTKNPLPPINVRLTHSTKENAIELSYYESGVNGGYTVQSYSLQVSNDSDFKTIETDYDLSIDNVILDSNTVIRCQNYPQYSIWSLQLQSINNTDTFELVIKTSQFEVQSKPLLFYKVIGSIKDETIDNIYDGKGNGSLEAALESLSFINEVDVTQYSILEGHIFYITFLDLTLDIESISIKVSNEKTTVASVKQISTKIIPPNRCFGSNIEIINLKSLDLYYVRVRSDTSVGHSEYENCIEPYKPTVYPQTVNNFTITPLSSSEILVAFITDMTSDYYVIECDRNIEFNSNSRGIMLYDKIWYSEIVKKVDVKTNSRLLQDSLSVEIGGLVEYETYYVRLTSGSSNEKSGWSKPSDSKDVTVFGLPTKPESIEVGITSLNSLTIRVTSPLKTEIIDEYIIEISAYNNFTTTMRYSYQISTTSSITITRLKDDENYYIRACAKNDLGESEYYTSSHSYRTRLVPPGQPIISDISLSRSTLRMNIKPPIIPHHGIWCSGKTKAENCPIESTYSNGVADGGSAIISYLVEYSISPDFINPNTTKFVPIDKTTMKVTALLNLPYDGIWYIRVYCENIYGSYKSCNRICDTENECNGKELIVSVSDIIDTVPQPPIPEVEDEPTEEPTTPLPPYPTTLPPTTESPTTEAATEIEITETETSEEIEYTEALTNEEQTEALTEKEEETEEPTEEEEETKVTTSSIEEETEVETEEDDEATELDKTKAPNEESTDEDYTGTDDNDYIATDDDDTTKVDNRKKKIKDDEELLF